MFAVIFEVQPRKERWDDYLELAKHLKPRLEAIDGFIDNERFISKRAQGRVLSLSTWRDEKSVVRWRTEGEHRGVQEKGRSKIFHDYHLRVGEITVDTRPPQGLSVEQTRFDETEVGQAKVVTITEVITSEGRTLGAAPDPLPRYLGLEADTNGLVDYDAFESIYDGGKLLLLAAWRDADVAGNWTLTKPLSAHSVRQRHVRIIRDYGMFDRREAPQYFPAVGAAMVDGRTESATG